MRESLGNHLKGVAFSDHDTLHPPLILILESRTHGRTPTYLSSKRRCWPESAGAIYTAGGGIGTEADYYIELNIVWSSTLGAAIRH